MALASLLLALCLAGSRAQTSWMGENWHKIKDKKLLDLTLPGSHNSGNTPQLSSDRLCQSNYQFQNYRDAAPPRMRDCLSCDDDFDTGFIPWNINHDHGIEQQLDMGTRFFHLKVCNFGTPGADEIDLAQVFHQHRGYTSPVSLADTVSSISHFLVMHPKEFVVLGFNNLHNNASSSFGAADVKALAAAVQKAFRKRDLKLINEQQLFKQRLVDLALAKARVAVFMKGSAEDDLGRVLPSSEYMIENWGDAMDSGDLNTARAWLAQDLVENAVQRGKFYVMQANPNNANDNMFAVVRAQAAGVSGLLGGTPQSLQEWERPLLEGLGDVIQEALLQDDQIKINAISTDFLTISNPYVIAMELNGLPPRFKGEVPTDKTNWACVNPAVITSAFADSEVDPAQYALKSAYVMQRHTDRWIYRHDGIDNYCWEGQLNSSRQSSKLAAKECDFATRKLSTPWEQFESQPDPYAKPERGTCQVHDSPQGTHQGRLHAAMWGQMLRRQYVDSGLVPASCPKGAVALHGDNHYHANQLTLQTEYEAICGRKPDSKEFPRNSTIVEAVPDKAKGLPWYIQKRKCDNPRLGELSSQASEARLQSAWWKEQVQAVAREVAGVTGHGVPDSGWAAGFLDNVLDCATVHACTGLGDTPQEFLAQQNGLMLPDVSDAGLYMRMDRNETAERTWDFDYWRKTDMDSYKEYASLYYGYFFAVLSDQLRAAAAGDPRAPKLTVTVMSDSNISPQLAFYNLSHLARQRPPYLSSLIHEIYEGKDGGKLFVRVLFNGKVERVCAGADSLPLCPVEEWLAVLAPFIPSEAACPELYSGYEFLAPKDWVGSKAGFLSSVRRLRSRQLRSDSSDDTAMLQDFMPGGPQAGQRDDDEERGHSEEL